jgi:uncharacterized protein YecE (DUF72 family)
MTSMSLLPLFGPDEPQPPQPPQAARLAPKLRALAQQGIYLGTSSWKYAGWLGSIYSPERYTVRAKISQRKFETECLAEYALTFPTVCGDFAFYQFPSPDYWQRLVEGVPESLLFGFKVPEEITVARWPGHARYGPRAGQENEGFLSNELFKDLFVRRLERYADRVGVLIFEFGTFAKSTFPTLDDFVARLDPFLEALPGGFQYSVEIRNPEYLKPAYFDLLARHNVAHVLNAWTRMPELGRQVEMPGVFSADFTVVRALLSKGRTYENAVRDLEPYELVREPDQPARDAMQEIARRSLQRKKPAFLFVNNRLEGNAPTTIEAVVDGLRVP